MNGLRQPHGVGGGGTCPPALPWIRPWPCKSPPHPPGKTCVNVNQPLQASHSHVTHLVTLAFELLHPGDAGPVALEDVGDVATPDDLSDREDDLSGVTQHPVLTLALHVVGERRLDEPAEAGEHRLLHLAQPRLHVAARIQVLQQTTTSTACLPPTAMSTSVDHTE